MSYAKKALKIIKLIDKMKLEKMTIDRIAQFLGTGKQSARQLLKALREDDQFEVKKEKIVNSKKYNYSLQERNPTKIFTTEEMSYLVPLINQNIEQSPLSESILHKVIANYKKIANSNNEESEKSLNMKFTKIVSNITDCIDNKKAIELIGYRSSNSGKISNRIVEPIGFSRNYKRIYAYELKTGQNKTFVIKRMESADQASLSPWKHDHYHKKPEEDIFGYSMNEHRQKVELSLTLNAYNVLLEDYPDAEKYIDKEKLKEGEYVFKHEVTYPDGIGRFILGLCDEIEIIEGEEVKKYIDNKIKIYTR